MNNWLLYQDGATLYVGLFFLLMSGAVGLPIPEDLPLILAGIIAHNGNGRIEILFAVCYSAIILGDLLIYGIGRKFGPALYKFRWFNARINHQKMLKIRRRLERRSILMIFLARHLFYLRTITFLACGMVGVRFKRFLIADAAAALISVPIMMWLGYTGADQYDAIVSSHRRTNILTAILGIALIIGLAAFYIKRRRSFDIESDEVSADDQETETSL